MIVLDLSMIVLDLSMIVLDLSMYGRKQTPMSLPITYMYTCAQHVCDMYNWRDERGGFSKFRAFV
jgi:hypothetical protein